ncbi:hypothetical protein A9Q84_19450 [Halobacteriovorax marinus]|uniref:Endonuclease/exonuclease/phosphatase domain-containing protein n=1 Tax=Halobacteriovorax marinus TaxID=97084 RepID=A0A1Y5F2I3_9BACT|nr:hypothetical protein A9Q84_19450 [Halobacteriovorax marinus]
MKIVLVFLISMCAYSAGLKVETFNAGLAHTYVPFAKERLPYIIKDLKEKQSDVICLQEIWEKKDRKEIVKSLKDIYPYAHFTKIKQVRSKKSPTCKRKNLFGEGKFVSCILDKCKGKEGDEHTACILNTCGESMERLKDENRECAAGLIAQVGKSTISALFQVFNPFRGSSLFAYGGGNGLLVLSKKKIVKKEMIDFTDISNLNKRAALLVTLETGETVACTHLTANLADSVSYTGKFSSWKEENSKQIEVLLNTLSEKSSKVVLTGDFNCAFSTENLEGDWEDNCQKILDSGYENRMVSEASVCTFCSSNALNPANTKDIMIDHIFVKNAQTLDPRRTRDVKFSHESREMNLSDHFGISATIE